MELKIYSPQDAGFVQKIEWNFDELKAEITAASQEYATSVYTDDAMKKAKADRAKLRKFADAMTGKRTDIRKQLLKPDELFGEQIKELTGIIEKAITNIDDQVKGYEERLRKEKTDKVREFYDENINDLERYLPFEAVFKPQYANSSTTMKSIKEEILELIQRVAEGIAILNEVDSPYAGEMKEVFLRTYNIGDAMAERNRLEIAEQKRKEYAAEQERRKAEREAAVKKQASAVINAGRTTAAGSPVNQEAHASKLKESEVEQTYTLDFRVEATKEQLDKLKLFLVENHIKFGQVPKGEK